MIINPAIEPLLERYEVKSEMVYYEYFEGKQQSQRTEGGISSHGNNLRSRSDLFTEKYKNENRSTAYEVLISAPDQSRSLNSLEASHSSTVDWHKFFADPVNQPIPSIKLPNVYIMNGKIVCKVTVTMYPKEPYDTTPIVMTRTYDTKIVVKPI
ncbi:MAG: hypothetical protein LUD68_00740 [Rikenellaceae bacterium]|nr:hypothetical protein [Rikenellaceae bacterium]